MTDSRVSQSGNSHAAGNLDALDTLTRATVVPADRICYACGEMAVSIDTAEAAQILAKSLAVPDEVRGAWGRLRAGYQHSTEDTTWEYWEIFHSDLALVDRFLGGDE